MSNRSPSVRKSDRSPTQEIEEILITQRHLRHGVIEVPSGSAVARRALLPASESLRVFAMEKSYDPDTT